jgi:hypothetical protein
MAPKKTKTSKARTARKPVTVALPDLGLTRAQLAALRKTMQGALLSSIEEVEPRIARKPRKIKCPPMKVYISKRPAR